VSTQTAARGAGGKASLDAPFPYFGGKSAIAHEVWRRFGDVPNLVEPFFGSGAVLLSRPAEHEGCIETANDLDGLLSNFWRALKADPEAVAHHADWPVSECDLFARHVWLVQRRDSLTERLMADPDWYDAKAAGWWCWGICCWIGSGWCSGEGPWTVADGKLVNLRESGSAGQGVNKQLVHLASAGRGVNRKRVQLGNAGTGVNRKLMHQGQRVNQVREWFHRLAERLRRVRVCCGDWSRVCGPTPTIKQGLTGVFLDPPYSQGRTANLYAHDSMTVADDVRAWAIEWGEHPLMRIALCGYDPLEMPEGWTPLRWKAHGGYGSQGDGDARENAGKEIIWFSPGCLGPDRPMQAVLW